SVTHAEPIQVPAITASPESESVDVAAPASQDTNLQAAEEGIASAEPSLPEISHEQAHAAHAHQANVDKLCEQIGNKLGSVSVEDCARQDFVFGGSYSVNQRPLVIKDYRP